MKHTKSMYYQESHEATELYFFCINTRQPYEYLLVPVRENLKKKYAAGKYNREKAIDAYYYAVNAATKLYNKMYSTPGSNPFNVTARYTVATMIENHFSDEMED